MLGTYLDILRYRQAWKFSAAGLVLRLPMSMVGLSTILMVRAEYGNYTLAGAVSAVNIIVMAICAPVLARRVDRHGQLRVMGPAWVIATLSMCGLVAAVFMHAPPNGCSSFRLPSRVPRGVRPVPSCARVGRRSCTSRAS